MPVTHDGEYIAHSRSSGASATKVDVHTYLVGWVSSGGRVQGGELRLAATLSEKLRIGQASHRLRGGEESGGLSSVTPRARLGRVSGVTCVKADR